MNQFRRIRGLIRNLAADECYGITRCYVLKGTSNIGKQFFIAKRKGDYKGRPILRVHCRISNWRKRLAILELFRR